MAKKTARKTTPTTDDTFERILTAQPAEGLALIKQLEDEAAVGKEDEVARLLAPFKNLHLSNYFAGQGDFGAAAKAASQASDGFPKIDFDYMQPIAAALAVFYGAAHEITSGNWGTGLKQLADFKALVQSSGNPDLFQIQDLQQPQLLYLSAARAFQDLDFERAKALYAQAVTTAEQVAGKFEEGTQERSSYSAIAKIYDAEGRYRQAINDIHSWNFAGLAETTQMHESYNQTFANLKKKKLAGPMFENFERLAEYYPTGFAVLHSWGELVCSEPVSVDQRRDVIQSLLKRLDAAQKTLIGGGEKTLPSIRGISFLKSTLENYQSVMEAISERASRAAMRSGPISLFVMIPYEDAYRPLEQALREVFETDPYNFQIILARDSKIDKDLFPNIRKLMHMADGFIGDISEHNPSVMMEIGIAAADATDRPFLILRNKDKKPTPPDLEGRLRVEYSSPLQDDDVVKALTAVLTTEVRKVDEFEQLRKNRRARFLSKIHLRRVAQNGGVYLKEPEQLEAVLARYKTVEEVLARDALQLARETRLPGKLATNLLQAFRSTEPVTPKATASKTRKR